MKEIVVFQFNVLDENIEQEAANIICDLEGVIDEVLSNTEEGQIMVVGEFDKFEMTSELKKLDESVDIIEVIPFEQEDEPEVNNPVKATTSTTFPSSFGGATPPNKPPVSSSTAVQPNLINKFGQLISKFGQLNPVNNFGQANQVKKVVEPNQVKNVVRPLRFNKFEQPIEPNKVNMLGQLKLGGEYLGKYLSPWLNRNQNQNGKKVEKLHQSPWKPKEVKTEPINSFTQFKREEARVKKYKKEHPSLYASSSKGSTSKTGDTTQGSTDRTSTYTGSIMNTISSITTSLASSSKGTPSTANPKTERKGK